MRNLAKTSGAIKFDPSRYPATGPKRGTKAWRKWKRWRHEQQVKAWAHWRDVLGIAPDQEAYLTLPFDFVMTGIWCDSDEAWLQELGRRYRAHKGKLQ